MFKKIIGNFLTKILNKEPINVLMLAPSGIGKTSVVAGLYKETAKNKIGELDLFAANDKTESILNEKLNQLMDEISVKEVVVQKKLESTSNDELYKFHLAPSRNSDQKIEINITDIRGGDVKDRASRLRDKLENVDVVLIPIDAAALVERDLDGRTYNSEVNAIQHMETLFRTFRDIKRNDQLIIFMPVKSEKYFSDKKLNLEKLYTEFEKVYGKIINDLRSNNRTVFFIPVQTMGGVKFSEIRDGDFVFKLKDASSSYDPKYLEIIFQLIIIYALTKKYKEKKDSFVKVGGLKDLKTERDKYLKYIQDFNRKEKLITTIYGEDKLFGDL